MQQVIVSEFGGVEKLQLTDQPDLAPGPGQVLVRLTCIGLNHADLMARRGEYKLASGDPPFTPGIEGGGVIEAAGEGVESRRTGQRVVLPLGIFGTYTTHMVVDAEHTIIAPDGVDNDHLGAMWLAYLTAWGCLIWRANLSISQTVLLPAASSAVSLAASQITRRFEGVSIGLTRSPEKVDTLTEHYDHLVCTADDDWYKQVKAITNRRGVNLVFDPVAAGDYLSSEIRLLARAGTIWIYGLLGEVGPVNVHPLIIKQGAIRGWLVHELRDDQRTLNAGYQHIMREVAAGHYRLPIAGRFTLDDIQHAHETLAAGNHIGKYILELS